MFQWKNVINIIVYKKNIYNTVYLFMLEKSVVNDTYLKNIKPQLSDALVALYKGTATKSSFGKTIELLKYSCK